MYTRLLNLHPFILCLTIVLAAKATYPAQQPTPPKPKPDYNPTQWTEIQKFDSTILLDLRYATTNNFTKTTLYPTPRAFLRPNVATALKKAQQQLKPKGYRLKIFDAYRPRPIQYKLWKIKPDPHYVTNPAKGSMHNRGMAVDLTIVDTNGNELNMGTDFDYFGERAHHDTNDLLPIPIQTNRKLLLQTMQSCGFIPTRTEWWHYAFKGKLWDLSDWVWK